MKVTYSRDDIKNILDSLLAVGECGAEAASIQDDINKYWLNGYKTALAGVALAVGLQAYPQHFPLPKT